MPMLDLDRLIAAHEDEFRRQGLLKIASDIAKFLAWELKDRSGMQTVLENKEELFYDFCALCLQTEAPLPQIPKKLLTYRLTDARGKTTTEFTTKVKERLKDCKKPLAITCLRLCALFETFPGFADNEISIDSKMVLAKINLLLLKLGKEPILPDFSKRAIDSSKNEVGPSTLKTVLIVDDVPADILTTTKPLAGWPNLDINYLLYQGPNSWNPIPKQVRQALEKHANIILQKHADIVLMDQGLGYNGQDGSRLIQLIREMGDRNIVFVANTDGNPAELYAAGALENCCKGQCLNGIRAAIQIVS